MTLNSHEVLEHSQTKAPCYPARTDGLPTPNLSEKTKGDSNRRSKTEEKCTTPTPIIITTTPIISIRPSGPVVDACSKCASCLRTAMQPSKIMSAKTDSHLSTRWPVPLAFKVINNDKSRYCFFFTKCHTHLLK